MCVMLQVEDIKPSNNNDNEEKGNIDEGVTRTMRPTSARLRPPKVKEGAREVTAKDTAPAVVKKAEGILVDGQEDEEDIVEAVEDTRLADAMRDNVDAKGGAKETAAQSKLVQDIRTRQLEQEALARGTALPIVMDEKPPEDATADSKQSGGIRLTFKKTADKKSTGGSAASAAGAGASSSTVGGAVDIDKLRSYIQSLVKCTGPLGSCMDFIQEDISLMSNELKKWEEECVR